MSEPSASNLDFLLKSFSLVCPNRHFSDMIFPVVHTSQQAFSRLLGAIALSFLLGLGPVYLIGRFYLRKVALGALPYQWIWDHEKKIGDLIREFRKEEGLRRSAPERVDNKVSMLKKMVGGIKNSRSFFMI